MQLFYKFNVGPILKPMLLWRWFRRLLEFGVTMDLSPKASHNLGICHIGFSPLRLSAFSAIVALTFVIIGISSFNLDRRGKRDSHLFLTIRRTQCSVVYVGSKIRQDNKTGLLQWLTYLRWTIGSLSSESKDRADIGS